MSLFPKKLEKLHKDQKKTPSFFMICLTEAITKYTNLDHTIPVGGPSFYMFNLLVNQPQIFDKS
jgi:hypothetical protein